MKDVVGGEVGRRMGDGFGGGLHCADNSGEIKFKVGTCTIFGADVACGEASRVGPLEDV